MYHDPGHPDLILADFEARLLAGQEGKDDPAEAHMNWFKRVASLWTAVSVTVAGVALWLSDAHWAAVVLALVTLTAVAARVAPLRRERRPAPPSPDMS